MGTKNEEITLHQLIYDWIAEDEYLLQRVKPAYITSDLNTDMKRIFSAMKGYKLDPPIGFPVVWGVQAYCKRWVMTIHPDHVRFFQGPHFQVSEPDFFTKVKAQVKYDLDRCDHAETLRPH